MKKALLFLVFLFPCIVFAQNDNPISDDLYTNTKGISNVIHLANDINVMQVSIDENTFDLIAVNSTMKVLWRTTLQGYGINIGEFKGKIAVVTATQHTSFKGNGNTYKASMIDPATGKVLVERVIYQDNNDYIEVPYILIGDNYFKFAVRETNVARKLHVGVPIPFVLFFQLQAWNKEENETKKFQVFDFNEKLDTINTVNPIVNGTLINITCNKNGDMFVSWLNSSDIEVYNYPIGKSAPSSQLTADIAIKPNDDTNLSELILFTTSDATPDDFYYTFLYQNEDKKTELMVGKMDFSKNTKSNFTHVFEKDELKSLGKSFIPVDKKFNDHDLGNPKVLSLRNITKTDKGLIAILQGGDFLTGGGTQEEALLFYSLTNDLQPDFQQIFPTENIFFTRGILTANIHTINDKLYMVTNSNKYKAIYSILELNTGQWSAMYTLIKKQDKSEAGNVLWFSNDFMVPFYGKKRSFGLQLNQY